MKINVHMIATYVALILISSLPLSVNTYADIDKKPTPAVLSNDDDDELLTKRKLPKRKDP